MLKIEGLRKSYTDDSNPVLADFSLEVRRGEFVTLIGPSGCGKTTALRIITGLLKPDAGAVSVDDRPSPGPSRDKAMVFQHFNLFPWRSAIKNAAYGLEMQGVPEKTRLATAAEYLRLVGLGKHLDYFPWQLSGGMRQRVGLARALAIRPKVLLMDEPFGSLDALTREQLQGMLQKICVEQNLTVLFVTHSTDEAIYLSDRVVVMGVRPGRIIAEFAVNVPRPRIGYDWRADPEHARIRSQIWNLLEQQLERTEVVA
ncbi:MAG: ABC transporter ATP-binding protein [Chloroflexi bacterium]|nr:ABC transporter ATP-binding protein [Chloroflexota bacterium]